MEHQLKLSIKYFEHSHNGTKMFEIRKNDRNFRVDDSLVLREFDDTRGIGIFTGRKLVRVVIYIIQGVFGLPKDVCVMGLK